MPDDRADILHLPSGSDDMAARLSAALRQLPAPWFAVLDGAWFDDLPALLTAIGLAHRSLFLAGDDPDSVLAGPWLVEAADETGAARIVSIVGDLPALVFWSNPSGEAALHRHLRTINSVLIPTEEAAYDDDGGPGEARVLFRHWDPAVIVSILPLLDSGQAARMLGPSEGIALNDPDGGGVSRVVRPPGLPEPPPGPLRFTPDQIAALSEARMERFHRGTAAYLREHCPVEAGRLDDRALDRSVRAAEAQARGLGLDDGEDLRRWAWLWVESEGRIAQEGDMRRFMLDPANGRTPKARLDRFWQELSAYADAAPASPGRR